MSVLKLSGALLASTVLAAMPAVAANVVPTPITFNFAANNVNNNVSDGNARIYTSNNSSWGTFNVRATAWTLETTAQGTFLRDARLQVWDKGLGVLGGDDGDGSSNRHTVDNQTRTDFIMLQFDRRLVLTGMTVNAFGVSGQAADSDATIAYGMTASQWNQSLQLDNQPLARLQSMLTGQFHSYTGNGVAVSGARSWNDRQWGNLWVIAATTDNKDGRIDGFKLAGLAAIPEPATWAMMIAGFGFVGASVRRQRAKVAFG